MLIAQVVAKLAELCNATPRPEVELQKDRHIAAVTKIPNSFAHFCPPQCSQSWLSNISKMNDIVMGGILLDISSRSIACGNCTSLMSELENPSNTESLSGRIHNMNSTLTKLPHSWRSLISTNCSTFWWHELIKQIVIVTKINMNYSNLVLTYHRLPEWQEAFLSHVELCRPEHVKKKTKKHPHFALDTSESFLTFTVILITLPACVLKILIFRSMCVHVCNCVGRRRTLKKTTTNKPPKKKQ